MRRALTLLILAVAVSGCAAVKGWFSDTKKDNIQPPTPLTELAPTVSVQKLWDERVGKGAGTTGVRLAPAYADGKLYAIGVDGTIAAFDAGSGHTLWNKHLGQRSGLILHRGKNSVRLAGGPAVDGNLVVAGTLEGVVQAFDAGSGAERWHAEVSSEVVAPPAIAEGIVVVRTGDGRLYGFDANDGSRKWIYDRSTVPGLSRAGMPRAHRQWCRYAGEDNGKVIALRLTDGACCGADAVPGEAALKSSACRTPTAAWSSTTGFMPGVPAAWALIAHRAGRYGRTTCQVTGVSLAATQVYAVDAIRWYGADLRGSRNGNRTASNAGSAAPVRWAIA